jgi:hypothetical protein
MQILTQGHIRLKLALILRVFNAILIWLSPRQRIVGFSHSGQIHARDAGKSQFLSAPSVGSMVWEQSHLDRCCNKPVVSVASLATGKNSLHESPNRPDTDLVRLHFSNSFPTVYMPAWLLPLWGDFLSVRIAALRQLTFVHEQFLERGQEVSHDLFVMSRRNFS